jgi:hypothetical protein
MIVAQNWQCPHRFRDEYKHPNATSVSGATSLYHVRRMIANSLARALSFRSDRKKCTARTDACCTRPSILESFFANVSTRERDSISKHAPSTTPPIAEKATFTALTTQVRISSRSIDSPIVECCTWGGYDGSLTEATVMETVAFASFSSVF